MYTCSLLHVGCSGSCTRLPLWKGLPVCMASTGMHRYYRLLADWLARPNCGRPTPYQGYCSLIHMQKTAAVPAQWSALVPGTHACEGSLQDWFSQHRFPLKSPSHALSACSFNPGAHMCPGTAFSGGSQAASTHAHSRWTFAALASQENCGARVSTVRHRVGRCCFGADAFTYAGASADASCSHLHPHMNTNSLPAVDISDCACANAPQLLHATVGCVAMGYRNGKRVASAPRLARKVLPQHVAVVQRGQVLRRAPPPRALAQRGARLARRPQHDRHELGDLRRRRRRRRGLPCRRIAEI